MHTSDVLSIHKTHYSIYLNNRLPLIRGYDSTNENRGLIVSIGFKLGQGTKIQQQLQAKISHLPHNTKTKLFYDPGVYQWPPTFSNSLKTIFWQFWQFTIFSSF